MLKPTLFFKCLYKYMFVYMFTKFSLSESVKSMAFLFSPVNTFFLHIHKAENYEKEVIV